MLEVGLILVFFAILPALLGYITNALNSPTQRSWYAKQWATLKAWQALDYARALFVLCAALLYVAGGSAYLGVKLSMLLALTLMIGTCLSALLYLWVFADMTQKVNSYEQRIKFCLGLIVISIATASKIYSDAGIAELTGLPPPGTSRSPAAADLHPDSRDMADHDGTADRLLEHPWNDLSAGAWHLLGCPQKNQVARQVRARIHCAVAPVSDTSDHDEKAARQRVLRETPA